MRESEGTKARRHEGTKKSRGQSPSLHFLRAFVPTCFRACAYPFILLLASSCYFDEPPKPYGTEYRMEVPGHQTVLWAVAPAINLSGEREVDPILQADLVYQELQDVHGMTAVPVDRVAQVFAGLNIRQIESPQQAEQVCQILQVDALVIPTVTSYDPYVPPKMAASLALFYRSNDVERLRQTVGNFDSADGSVRNAMLKFASGRSDPNGPMADREYYLSMDRYAGFVYHQLIADLLGVPAEQPDDPPAGSHKSTGAAGQSDR
jgi:hypothetical protein